MSYIETDDIMSETTEEFAMSASSSIVVIPPKGTSIMSIASATDNISISIGGGTAIVIAPASITTAGMPVYSMNVADKVVLSTTGSNDVVVRWLAVNPLASSVRRLSVETASITVDTNEVSLAMPKGALELSITSLSVDLDYRIDTYSVNTGIVTLSSSLLSFAFPYNIPLSESSRLRIKSTSGTCTIQGYWIKGHTF